MSTFKRLARETVTFERTINRDTGEVLSEVHMGRVITKIWTENTLRTMGPSHPFGPALKERHEADLLAAMRRNANDSARKPLSDRGTPPREGKAYYEMIYENDRHNRIPRLDDPYRYWRSDKHKSAPQHSNLYYEMLLKGERRDVCPKPRYRQFWYD